MTFHRKPVITYDYQILNISLDAVSSFMDLGVSLDPKLKFNSHIVSSVNKAKGVLGFVKRWAKEFKDPY